MRKALASLAVPMLTLSLVGCDVGHQPAHSLPPQAKTPSQAESTALGGSGQKNFLAIGLAFVVIGIVLLARGRKAGDAK